MADTPAHLATHPLPTRRADHRHHRGDDGRAAAGARHDHRQRRAAAHAGEPQRDAGQHQLGADQLYRRLGDRAADQRLARRPGRAQAAAADLGRRLHHRVGAVRDGDVADRDGAVPRAPGRQRRVHRPARPGDLVRHQPAREARPGDGPVRRRRDDRADPRAGARRLADRQLQLALGVPGQPAGRRPLHLHHAALHAEDRDASSASSTCSASRCSRSRSARCSCSSTAASRRTGSTAGRSIIELGPRDRAPAGCSSSTWSTAKHPLFERAHVRRPQFRDRPGVHGGDRRAAARRPRAAAAAAPEPVRLFGASVGLPDRAARRRDA